MAAMTDFKRGPKLGDAASLWNFTPSPGWTADQAATLKLCLMRLGVGRWVQIQATGLLPGKMVQQLNGQTQRLLGQQSLAAYTGLQIDVDRIRRDNEARTDAQRKGGLIIWSGPNPTKAMKDRWQVEAKAKYGLSAEQLAAVEAEFAERVEALRMEAGNGNGGGKGGAKGDGGASGPDASGGRASESNAAASAAAVALEAGVSTLLASSEASTAKPLAGDAKLLLLRELRDKLAEVAAAVAARDAAAAEARRSKAEREKVEKEKAAAEAAAAAATAAAAAAPAPMETEEEAAPAPAATTTTAAEAAPSAAATEAEPSTTAAAPAVAAADAAPAAATTSAPPPPPAPPVPPPPPPQSNNDAPVDPAAVAAGRPSAPAPSKRASAPSAAAAAAGKKEAAARKKAKTSSKGAPASAPSSAANDDGGAVSQVVAMGFPKAKAREALAESGGDVAAALEWLCSNLC